MWYSFIRSLLFKLDPEQAHHLTFRILQTSIGQCLTTYSARHYPSKPLVISNLHFKNPIGLAAGLDKNGDYLKSLASLGFGFIELGTVTPKPQPGNPKPRLFRIPEAEALINRMGFNNLGVDYLVEKLQKRPKNLIFGANLGKNKDTPLSEAAKDYCECLSKVYTHIDYVTINLSSPNTPGLRELQSEVYLRDLLSALIETRKQLKLRTAIDVPIWIKIAPDITADQLETMVSLFLTFGIDGIIATNTTIDHNLVERFRFGQEEGGVSGAPLFSRSTQLVAELNRLLKGKIPIIAVGGILSAEDAFAKFAAGASLIQIYTGLIYRGPGLINAILKKL